MTTPWTDPDPQPGDFDAEVDLARCTGGARFASRSRQKGEPLQTKGTFPAVLYAAKSTEDRHGNIPD